MGNPDYDGFCCPNCDWCMTGEPFDMSDGTVYAPTWEDMKWVPRRPDLTATRRCRWRMITVGHVPSLFRPTWCVSPIRMAATMEFTDRVPFNWRSMMFRMRSKCEQC